MPVDKLNNTKFNLDSSGVAGFFGGEEAVSAMGTVHLYRGQKWLGWYNSPGSYTVAKQYGKLANNRFWDALFPGEDAKPSEFFGLDGKSGPEFIAWSSGNRLTTTGHIAYLFTKAAQAAEKIDVSPKYDLGTRSRPSYVTVVDLAAVKELSPELLQTTAFWAACVTMVLSIAPCVACGVFGDWYCFAMILLGIISNGFSCYVIGSGELQFQRPKPSLNSPVGNGILIAGPEVIILRGLESTVGAVTMGNFNLTYFRGPECRKPECTEPECREPEHREPDSERRAIGVCSLFQYAQFLAQLLLIPQGTLFGQIMFLATFAASWVYNCYLSSRDKEQLQIELMMKTLDKPEFQRFKLQTRTTMVVLALLVLKPDNPEEFLDKLLPKGTTTWTTWRENVLAQFRSGNEFNFDISKIDASTKEGGLLVDLFQDAETAYRTYRDHFVDKRTSQASNQKMEV